MKHDSSRLVYHTPRSRSMRGHFFLFFFLAAVFVVGIVMLFDVRVSAPLRPQGVGVMIYKNDELTQFLVRQQGVLPLHLPRRADPFEDEIEIPKTILMDRRKLPLITAPPEQILPSGYYGSSIDADVPMPDLEKLPVKDIAPVAPRSAPRQDKP